jgi:hypothetical protein
MQHYCPADTRARSALLAMCVWALAALAVVVAEMGRLTILNNISTGIPVSVHDTMLSDNFVTATAWAEVAAFVLTAAAFLIWLHRIAQNNRVLGLLGTSYPTMFAAASLVLFVLSGSVRYAAALTNQPVNPVAGLINSSMFEVGSIVLAGVAAVLAVILIVEVTRRQSARAASVRAEIGAASYAPSPPPLALPVASPANLQIPVSPGEA